MEQILASILSKADELEHRCAMEWDASTERRRMFRAMRRADRGAAFKFMMENGPDKESMPTASEIDELFDPVCGSFYMADGTAREEVAAFFHDRKRLLGNLRNYVSRCAKKLEETGDYQFMIRGLSAVVMDGGLSLLDFSSGVKDLYAAAREHGLNADTYFSYAGDISNAETRQLLMRFVDEYDTNGELTTDSVTGTGERVMPNQGRHVTDPSYISAQMFAKVLNKQFFENTDDPAVRGQAITLINLLRSSGCLPQIIVDVLAAVRVQKKPSIELTAEIAFSMGMQFGFELAHTHPSPVGGQGQALPK